MFGPLTIRESAHSEYWITLMNGMCNQSHWDDIYVMAIMSAGSKKIDTFFRQCPYLVADVIVYEKVKKFVLTFSNSCSK